MKSGLEPLQKVPFYSPQAAEEKKGEIRTLAKHVSRKPDVSGLAEGYLKEFGEEGFDAARDKLERRIKDFQDRTPPKKERWKELGMDPRKLKMRAEQLEKAMVNGTSQANAMLTQEQLESNPRGSTDQELKWNHFVNHHNLDHTGKPVRVKARTGPDGKALPDGVSMVEEWRNIRHTLAEELDREFGTTLTSVDNFRPSKHLDLAMSQNPVSFSAPSFKSKAHYIEVFGEEAYEALPEMQKFMFEQDSLCTHRDCSNPVPENAEIQLCPGHLGALMKKVRKEAS